jgi:GLPGLI family protein
MIGGYLCYKATSPFYNLETWFDDNHKLDITAWYTTKIPVNFGPNGYHGLPGLILELQTRMATIYVKKINLNTTPTPVINKLDSYKLLTIGQRNMLLDKKFSPEMRRFIEDTEKQKNETIEKMKAEKK